MKIKMTYKEGRFFVKQEIEITNEEAIAWINCDYEKRLQEATEEERPFIVKRTAQEIADEFNRQEERLAKQKQREDIALTTVLDKSQHQIDLVNLLEDDNTLSPLDKCIQEEEDKAYKKLIKEKRRQLKSRLTDTQLRRFKMRLSGMTLREIV